MPEHDPIACQLPLSRRLFLGSCSALALAFAGCAGLGPAARVGYALLNDPPLEAYRAVLDALIAAILPLEAPTLPLSGESVRGRVLDLFRLDQDPRFVTVEKGLVLFDDVELFAYPAPLRAVERERQRSSGTIEPEAVLDRKETEERERFASFAAGAPPRARFRTLDLERRRLYLHLWARSAFVLRRQFYSSARALVLIAAYSMPDIWTTIGYEGPLVPARGSRHDDAARL